MYHYNIKRTINDIVTIYEASADTKKKHLVQIWITTSNGEVLIKDFDQTNTTIDLQKVSIESNNLNSAIKEVEKATNILCSKDDLSEAYCLESNPDHQEVDGYILCINLNTDYKSIIEDKFKGRFVDYRELTSLLTNYKLDMRFKEAFYSLVSILEQKNSFHPSL